MLPTLANCAKAAYTAAPSNANRFKRAGRGLFAGKLKLFGNNVPESHQKTRRTWTPNVQRKRLYSAALDESIPIKMTMAALRDVDKAGGLDEYLLKQSSLKHLGEFGLHLKAQILEARAENAADAQHEASQEATRLQQNQEQRAQIDHAFRGARRIEGPVSQ